MNTNTVEQAWNRYQAVRGAIGGLAEYEFEIEMLGHNYPAIASYEIDSDGLPEIHRVEIGRLMPFYDIATERMTECRESVDMTRMLDSDQLALIAEDILASLREAETDNRISRYELTRSERLAA